MSLRSYSGCKATERLYRGKQVAETSYKTTTTSFRDMLTDKHMYKVLVLQFF